MVGSSLVGAETESSGKEKGKVRRGGRGVPEWQIHSPSTNRTCIATTATTGVAAATEANNDDDDDEEEEEEETWALIPNSPSPLSTTNPALTLPGNGHESPDLFTAFQWSANPSPSSRSVTGSTSSSDAKWAGGFLHHQKTEDEGAEDEEPFLSSPNKQEEKQCQLARSAVGEWSDTFSSPSFASQREREAQQQEEHQNPRSRVEAYLPRASGRVLEVVQGFANPEMTERERGRYEGIGTHSPGGGALVGSNGEGGFGGDGETRGQGDGGEEGWEVV
ncbi:hypothetical protein KC332_g15711 [Hortaea werneckii]|nr:hypothetical protein KC350_g16153 [Hortaea werneckii]KAI6802771.1 hypothetical protein KC358_g15126 [Hortaea werneckii]KAI6903799.1 hypothetical protein KC348_g15535 [Hortaea werneckii]KAI6923127.1 hypothetical protein KC341_g14945 [Hortaea werneckii]KAI6956565.1 hypothetical protein KC321_g15097 [Hortaea werneckii]